MWTLEGSAVQLAPSPHTGQMMEPPTQPRITGALEGGRLTKAGLRAGHVVEIQHEKQSKRFRIVCPCGWHSDSRWNRKRTFFEATEHVILAGKAAQLAEQAAVGGDNTPNQFGHSGDFAARNEVGMQMDESTLLPAQD